MATLVAAFGMLTKGFGRRGRDGHRQVRSR